MTSQLRRSLNASLSRIDAFNHDVRDLRQAGLTPHNANWLAAQIEVLASAFRLAVWNTEQETEDED